MNTILIVGAVTVLLGALCAGLVRRTDFHPAYTPQPAQPDPDTVPEPAAR